MVLGPGYATLGADLEGSLRRRGFGDIGGRPRQRARAAGRIEPDQSAGRHRISRYRLCGERALRSRIAQVARLPAAAYRRVDHWPDARGAACAGRFRNPADARSRDAEPAQDPFAGTGAVRAHDLGAIQGGRRHALSLHRERRHCDGRTRPGRLSPDRIALWKSLADRIELTRRHSMERNLALEVVRATEAAALAASRFIGKGDERMADRVAAEAMRNTLNSIAMDGKIVVGEGDQGAAEFLYTGEI